VTHQNHAAFRDPVFDSQRAFRGIMDALAKPGIVQGLALNLSPPDVLPVAAAAAILTLCDFETELWVCPTITNANAIADYCAFHTGTKRSKTPDQAHFALIDLTSQKLGLADFAQGIAEYPDRSTTIICIVPSLIGGQQRTLSGPGIQNTVQFFAEGLPDDFDAQWAENHSSFPLGVDLVFCSGASLVGLPRSTRIMEV
jgi:alpha-D-ribose 1-methylphosphonate 5-triphosphate synthase subunit PhnH